MRGVEETIDLCLFHQAIPIELRRIVLYFVAKPFNNQSLRTAVALWNTNRHEAMIKHGHISGWDTSKVTNMDFLFHKNHTKGEIPTLNYWDVHNVTSMCSLFDGCEYFNQPLDKWDVSKVTNMKRMFRGCKSFNQPLNMWNTSQVTNMEHMFHEAIRFNQPLDQWNTCKVVTMNGMFECAKIFDQPLNTWNTHNVTSMCYIFAHAHKFNQSISDWDVSRVETLQDAFSCAYSFNQSFQSKWRISERCQLTDMLTKCRSYRQSDSIRANLPFTSDGLRKAVTQWKYDRKQALAIYGPMNTWNVSQVTDMSYLFRNDEHFNEPLNDWDVSHVTDMKGMFFFAVKFNQPLDQWNTINVKDMSEVFSYARAFNQPLVSWDIRNVENMVNVVGGAHKFNQPDTVAAWSVQMTECNVSQKKNNIVKLANPDESDRIDTIPWYNGGAVIFIVVGFISFLVGSNYVK